MLPLSPLSPHPLRSEQVDILILSNGPGELATWVLPVVRRLREQLGSDRSKVRISVVLSPCPNASGKEAQIARSYAEVDRVQGAEYFFRFLLWGKTVENWDWRDRGVVLFLGGDQFFTLVIGKRLRYRTVVYAEWEARWQRWIDRFGVMKPEIIASASPKYAHKFAVVGDLMAEAGGEGERGRRGEGEQECRGNPPVVAPEYISNPPVVAPEYTGNPPVVAPEYTGNPPVVAPEYISNPPVVAPQSKIELIGLLPGSKAAKLTQGVPLALAIAQHIHEKRPQTRFVIPVAPTLDLPTLVRFANPEQNPVIQQIGGASAELVFDPAGEHSYLKTTTGLCVELWTETPAYDLLSQCCLCLTTVGANTAELGALAVPMIVLVPTQQLDAMRSWDGLPGLLANLPILGSGFAKVINWLALRRLGLLAWPNIWAGATIVPELVGLLQPSEVAELALDFLQHPEKLQEMRDRLLSVRGQPGAAQKLASLVLEELVSDCRDGDLSHLSKLK